MNTRPVFYIVGLMLLALTILMLIPAFYLYFVQQEGSYSFLLSAIITFIFGALLAAFTKPKHFSLNPKETFLLTNCCWITASLFAALPLYIHVPLPYVDAYFETVSGITTTGATILNHLDTTNTGILLWRSLLQWVGGIGFIVVAVAILPLLKVGGMRLFHTESSDWSEKIMPRASSIAKRMVIIYTALTVLCALLYYVEGMTAFEAVNHAMTTLSTGGYSTSERSFAHFTNPLIHWTAMVFMLLGALPFVLFVKFITGDTAALLKDTQVRAFLSFILFICNIFSIWLLFSSNYDLFEAITLVSFNVISVLTTTGFALTDYSLWGGFASALFLLLTILGGCSGSTAGGIKFFRLQIGLSLLSIQLKQLVHPRAYFLHNYNGRQISGDILNSLIGFMSALALLIVAVTFALCLMGLDLLTSLSGTLSAIANVGPGLGNIIGPAGTFQPLPETAKWLLSMSMLMGRLEVITFLVILTPGFWKS